MQVVGTDAKLRQLQILREVMRTGSERAAARALDISQPAISQNLKKLEDSLGVALFTRDNGRLKPTEKAWQLLRSIDTAFAGFDRLGRSIASIQTEEQTNLAIAAPGVFCLRLLPALVTILRGEEPACTFSIKTGSYREIGDHVLAGRADIGLSRLPLDERMFDWAPVTVAKNVCLFPRGHRFAKLETVTAEDLGGEQLIDLDPQYASHQMSVSALRFAGETPDLIVEYDANGHDAGFVAAGIGVSISNEFVAKEYAHLAIETRPFEPSAVYHYVVFWQKDRILSHLLEFTVSAIRMAFDKSMALHGVARASGP